MNTLVFSFVIQSESKEVFSHLEGLIGIVSSTGYGDLWMDFAAAWDADQQALSSTDIPVVTWDKNGVRFHVHYHSYSIQIFLVKLILTLTKHSLQYL